MICPKCGKPVYVVCSNEDCKCRDLVPDGEKWLIDRVLFFGIIVPKWFETPLWRFLCAINRRFAFVEISECPYCGFRESMCFWEDLSMLDFYKEFKQDAD